MLQTIFAVPVFKFDNWWVDYHFQPVNTTADDGGSSTPSDSGPVFSGYGVLFLVISNLLTCLTVGLYFRHKRRHDEADREPALDWMQNLGPRRFGQSFTLTREMGSNRALSNHSGNAKGASAWFRAKWKAMGSWSGWPSMRRRDKKLLFREKGNGYASSGSPV